MRLGVRALGVLIELVSFEQNFHAAIAEKAVARAFHFSHRLDGRHIAVEQRGRFLKIIVVEFVWHLSFLLWYRVVLGPFKIQLGEQRWRKSQVEMRLLRARFLPLIRLL